MSPGTSECKQIEHINEDESWSCSCSAEADAATPTLKSTSLAVTIRVGSKSGRFCDKSDGIVARCVDVVSMSPSACSSSTLLLLLLPTIQRISIVLSIHEGSNDPVVLLVPLDVCVSCWTRCRFRHHPTVVHHNRPNRKQTSPMRMSKKTAPTNKALLELRSNNTEDEARCLRRRLLLIGFILSCSIRNQDETLL
jgi:hypothetical protein